MKPGLLIILDGFGFGKPEHPCNAVALAETPTLDRLRSDHPFVEIDNNQHHVGLPDGQMGNSEVGHLNIGAGRVLYQDFLRINNAIEDESFADNQAYQAAFDHVERTGGRLHIMGLLGSGGVHAHEDHFAALLWAAGERELETFVHAIGDGRDTDPRSAKQFMRTLLMQCEVADATVASFVGRYFAMDRDNRWERVEEAYRLYTDGTGHTASDAIAAVQAGYDRGEDDEFAKATLIDSDGVIRAGDAVIWANFRPDRSRELTRAFMQPDFDVFPRGFEGGAGKHDVLWVCTTQYDDAFVAWPGVQIAWPPNRPTGTLGEYISKLGHKQFRIAETEKYAHVTYFLNGGREEPFPGEVRELIPSPKVATYDLQPQMSAGEVTDRLLHALGSEDFDLLVVNFANPDMVGHTGNLSAAIEMMEFIDNCLNRLTTVANELGYVTLITSDHGNCEEMCKANHDGTAGDRTTNHSMGPSPLIVVGADVELEEGGALCNVAPTLLELMGLPIPPEMEAPSLVRP